MEREAKHEVNKDLKEFQQARDTQVKLQKVQLQFSNQGNSGLNENIPFSEMVAREIEMQQNRSGEDMERIRVITNMRDIQDASASSSSSQTKKRKGEYIEMNVDIMKAYCKSRQQLLKDPKMEESDSNQFGAQKDCTEESSINIQIDEKGLQKMFQKEDFKNLHVVGQFNKGFIMSTLNENDLFILDQHACDEKYNFETFSKAAVIETQDLIK